MTPDVRRGKAVGAQSGQITAKVSSKCFAQPPREIRATDLRPQAGSVFPTVPGRSIRL
jgi:hypothetical protein